MKRDTSCPWIEKRVPWSPSSLSRHRYPILTNQRWSTLSITLTASVIAAFRLREAGIAAVPLGQGKLPYDLKSVDCRVKKMFFHLDVC